MYTTMIFITEPSCNGEFITQAHEYRVETLKPFTAEDFENVLFQALEIEQIYNGRIFVEIIKEQNDEYLSSDEGVIEVKVELTNQLSDCILWEKCNPATPPIYKIDRSKSSFSVCIE